MLLFFSCFFLLFIVIIVCAISLKSNMLVSRILDIKKFEKTRLAFGLSGAVLAIGYWGIAILFQVQSCSIQKLRLPLHT